MRGHQGVRQLGLFGGGAPAFDGVFKKLERTELAPDAWFDYAPGWLTGHEALFVTLLETVHFRREKRQMYERIVDVPRLIATLPGDGPVPDVVEDARSRQRASWASECTRRTSRS